MQMNQNFCNGRLKSIDPDGHRLVGQMLEAADDVPALPSRPAMTAEQWHLWQQAHAAA